MDQRKRKGTCESFCNVTVSYCPLTWMFHRRNMELYINKILEWALKLVYDAPDLSVEELLVKDKSVNIHRETFKVENGIAPELTKGIFQIVKKAYNLRNTSILRRKWTKTVYSGR